MTTAKKKGPAKKAGPTKPPTEPSAPALNAAGGRFHSRLYKLRMERGLSQSDLARKIWGVTTDSNGYETAKNKDRISRWESGKNVPEDMNLRELAKALEVSVEELAPDLMTRQMDKDQHPAVSMTMVAGRPDMVHLVINTFTSLALASQVIALLSKDKATLAAMGA